MFLKESNMAVQFYNFLALLCVFVAVITAQTSTGETTPPKFNWRSFKTAHKLKCSPGEHAVCMPCPRDQMTPKASVVDQCADCTLYGKGTPKEGSSKCRRKCPPGKKYVDSSSTCEPCEAGTYMDIRGLNDTCKSCGPNMTSEAGARKCECMAGFQQVNGRCEACPEGRFKPEKGNNSCSKCPSDMTTLMDGAKLNETECIKSCPPGEQYNRTTKVCDQCKPGFSKELRGSRTKCEPCPIHTVAPQIGSRRCNVKCGKGYEITADGCKNCTWNTYKNRLGNDACTPCPEGTHTWSKGAKNHHECISSASTCVAPAITQIEYFYNAMESISLPEDADLIDAVLATCGTGLQDTFKAFMSGFATCLELINVKLPTVDITGRMYDHEDQMNLILDILNYQKNRPDGDYCEYLGCVHSKGWEVQDCIWAMADKTTGHPHDFCSQSGRVGASCVMLNFKSCPALQYSKVAEKIKVAGVSKLVRAKDVQSFCAGEEGEDSGIWNGGETGGGSCEDHLKQILSELDMSAASDICSESYRLGRALSCFKEHAIEDIFVKDYQTKINNLIPRAAVVGLPEMTLTDIINYLDTSCSNTGDCATALEPLLHNLYASPICDQYPSLRSALSCFVDNGMEHMFTEEYRAYIDPFIMSISPVGHTAGMPLNEMISILDTTCSSTADCGAALEPLLHNLHITPICDQYLPLQSALSCYVENGQMFPDQYLNEIYPFIMSLSPAGTTVEMSLNGMISMLDTSCSSTDPCAIGYYQSSESGDCYPCPVGSYKGDGDISCMPCDDGLTTYMVAAAFCVADCGAALEPLLHNLQEDASRSCDQYPSLRPALSCFVDNGIEHMFTDQYRTYIESLIMSLTPAGYAGMPLNDIISFFDMTCSSTGGGEDPQQSGCDSQLGPLITDLTMSNLCSQSGLLLGALNCYQNGHEAEFMELYYSTIFNKIDVAAEQIAPQLGFDVNHMTLQDIIAVITMYCGLQGTGGEQSGCASLLDPQLLDLSMSNLCSRLDPLLQALHCYQGENEMEFMDLYYNRILYMIDVDATQYFPDVNSMTLQDIIYFLDMHCHSQGTGGEQSPCALGMEDALNYPLDVTNFCDGASFLVDAMRCFGLNEEEFVMSEYSARLSAIIPYTFADTMPLSDIIAGIENYCPGMHECSSMLEPVGLETLDVSNLCERSHHIQDTLNCYQLFNQAEFMDVLDQIFYKIDFTVEALFPHLLDARGMITPKNMTHFLKVYCGPGECIDYDRILKEVTMTNVCNRYDDIKSALSCFTYAGGAEYFTEVYSADWFWIDALTFDGGHLELNMIMNFLANYCWSGMPTK